MSILVSGGAGYIGAHVVRLLLERGDRVVVADDFSTGERGRVEGATIVEIDIASDRAVPALANAMVDEDVSAVIHFAARKRVGESVARPLHYYQQNIGGLANVLYAMAETGVERFVFSSSAAVYGTPDSELVSEDALAHPINPYGETKLIGEWMMADCERAWGLDWVGLRYFNVAGTGWTDLADPAILNLVPMVLERVAKGEPARIFGTDYPTADGTCVRDYIHVLDLAKAHILALDALEGGARIPHRLYNVGTGRGTSVREIIDGLRAVAGVDFAVVEEARRPGDPAFLVGDPRRLEEDFGWRAEFGLAEILQSAWDGWQAGPLRITPRAE